MANVTVTCTARVRHWLVRIATLFWLVGEVEIAGWLVSKSIITNVV